jgi:sugar phosphate isomerase/epimerase
MLRFSVSEVSTIKWTFEEDVINYHQTGLEALGIWYPKLREYGEEKGFELLREHQIEASSITFNGQFTGCKGRSFRACLVEALDVIQTAADMQVQTVVLLAGNRNGHTRNHAMRIFRTAIKELAEAAEAVGVHIALEPIHSGCGPEAYLNTLPQCLDIISHAGSSNLGIVFDTYHLIQDSNAMNWFESVLPLVKLVQLGDAKCAPMGSPNRCLLGHGRLPLQQLIGLFRDSGYDGFYEIELFGEAVEQVDYPFWLDHSYQTAQRWQSTTFAKTV